MLSKFYMNHVQQARSNRTFHSLVTLHRLLAWGLGPIPTKVALAHKLTTRRRKFIIFCTFSCSTSFNSSKIWRSSLSFSFIRMATMKENKRKSHVSGDEAVQTKGDALIQSHPMASTAWKSVLPVSSEKRKTLSKTLNTGNFLAIEAIRSLNLALSLYPSPLSLSLIPLFLLLLPFSRQWLLKPILLSLMWARPWTQLLLHFLKVVHWLS